MKSEPPRPSVVVMPSSFEAMKPPITGTLPLSVSGRRCSAGALLDERVLRYGLLKLRVGEDDIARVDVSGVDASFAEGSGNDAAGEALSVTDNEIGDARGEFENRGQAAQNFVEGIELLINEIG